MKKVSLGLILLAIASLSGTLQQASANPIRQGIATHYKATDDGSCLFGDISKAPLVAAMNADEYNNAAVCGTYVQVKGPKGSVTIQIVNLCPECKKGHLDLSQQAFSRIAKLSDGKIPITWQVISPTLNGPISYHFKQGSNPWWTAVQIRNHRNPIAKLEYYAGGKWITVPRTNYNYFVQSKGMGAGPYQFRVTDSYGNQLIDRSIPHRENSTVNGSRQFPQIK